MPHARPLRTPSKNLASRRGYEYYPECLLEIWFRGKESITTFTLGTVPRIRSSTVLVTFWERLQHAFTLQVANRSRD